MLKWAETPASLTTVQKSVPVPAPSHPTALIIKYQILFIRGFQTCIPIPLNFPPRARHLLPLYPVTYAADLFKLPALPLTSSSGHTS